MIETAVAAGALIAAAILSVRLFAGPTFYDRALAAFSVNAMVGLAIAAVGALTGRLALIDLAIVLAGIGFILAVGVLKVLRLRSLQPSLDTSPSAPAPDQGGAP